MLRTLPVPPQNLELDKTKSCTAGVGPAGGKCGDKQGFTGLRVTRVYRALGA